LVAIVIKLTKRTVDALSPRQKQYVEYDTDLTGFGVAVYPFGVKSWICEYRPHGGGRGVAKKRVTLGKITQLTVEQASQHRRRHAGRSPARRRSRIGEGGTSGFGDSWRTDRAV
jgi:hypothetical protein